MQGPKRLTLSEKLSTDSSSREMVRHCPSQPETYSTIPDHVTPSTRVSRRPTRDPSPPPVSSTVRCRLVKTHLSLSLAPRPRPKTSLHRYSSINTRSSVNSVLSPCLTARTVWPPRVAVSELRPNSHTVTLWARSMMIKCLTSKQLMSRQSVSPHDEGYSEENDKSGSRQFRMNSDFGASSDAHHHCETMLPRDQEQHEYETMCHPSHSRLHKAHEDYIKRLPAFVKLTIPQPVVPSNYDVPPIPRPVVPSNYYIPRPIVPSNYYVPPIPRPIVHSNYYIPPIPQPVVSSNYDVPPRFCKRNGE
ncbi:hypothetical protein GBAR_LOCUS12334 [Geodia barretti]|uniref:Uncharacterized protein n=1 Tax=Geodia barretti TaxID=519541 RepID=A0AA35S221_GEOBA|nr:hypothetical protein GBAR_LOCUS12334 [Geodia barretti]